MNSPRGVEELDREHLVWMYRQMSRIREFEERVKRTFEDHPGVIRGHTHLADVAEASIVGSIATLGAERARIVEADALQWLDGPPGRFDIVFLDPPFESGLLAEAFRKLDSGGWLSPSARVYLEGPVKAGPPPLPAGWTLHRSGKAGAVGYHLALK